MDLRENDICTWRWKDDERHRASGPFGSYHCNAQKGIVHNGRLLDLFWMNIGSHFAQEGWSKSRSGGKPVALDQVIVEVVANIDDLTEIRRGDERYYDLADVVDLQNSNSSKAPIFIRKVAQRSQAAMLEYAENKLQEAERTAASAERDVERWTALSDQIQTGNLDKIYL